MVIWVVEFSREVCKITLISLINVESTLTNFEKFHPPQKEIPPPRLFQPPRLHIREMRVEIFLPSSASSDSLVIRLRSCLTSTQSG